MRAALIVALALVPLVAQAAPNTKAKKAKKAKKAPAPEPAPVDDAPEVDMTPPPAPEPAPAPTPAAAPDEVLHDTAPVPVTLGKPKKLKRFYVRFGVAHVAPLATSRPMELADVDGAASLAVQNGPIAGSGSDVSSATIPAIALGFRLPFGGDHLSLETVLGLPFTVKFRATGTLANMSIAPTALGIPTGVGPLGPELGEAKAAPPLLTLVYNFFPRAKVQPFLGAGAAVLFAFNPKVTNPMLTEVSQPEMSIAPAPGLVLQAGLEAKIYKGLYARFDVKFIAFMLARAEVHHVQVRTPELPLFDTVEVGTAKMSVWVNPLIIQGGLGFDF
jgi:outer membrane protein W